MWDDRPYLNWTILWYMLEVFRNDYVSNPIWSYFFIILILKVLPYIAIVNWAFYEKKWSYLLKLLFHNVHTASAIIYRYYKMNILEEIKKLFTYIVKRILLYGPQLGCWSIVHQIPALPPPSITLYDSGHFSSVITSVKCNKRFLVRCFGAVIASGNLWRIGRGEEKRIKYRLWYRKG